jgi:hypothetical protein
VERCVKSIDIQGRISQCVQNLSGKLLDLATSSWQMLKEQPEVAQELAKDPFTGEAKAQAATAELLLLLLHACDRVSSAAFGAALPAQLAPVLRNSFMAALVEAAIPTFVRIACPEEDSEEQEETQADLLHLYNARAIQYGFFALGGTSTPDGHDPLFKLAGIRLAEALECPDNAAVITYGVEVIMASLAALREQLPLKETVGQLIAGAR